MATNTQKVSTHDKNAFDSQYVSTNMAKDAPAYSKEVIQEFRCGLLDMGGDEFQVYSYGILTAALIGAHRGDLVPKMFEDAIDEGLDEAVTADIFYTIRECIMAIWAFVGLPWCIPACLGCVAVLERKGLAHVGNRTIRPQDNLDMEKLLERGREVNAKTYERVNNSEVRSMMTSGFSELRLSLSALVWGYSVGGAWESGVVTPAETELMIASAIIAGGASRQSRSHVKASIGLGNRLEVVKRVVELISALVTWNQTPLPRAVDVDELAKEMDAL